VKRERRLVSVKPELPKALEEALLGGREGWFHAVSQKLS
jgi:hypothetical protein